MGGMGMTRRDRGLLEAAIAYAVKAHTGHVDLNGDPYILHPLRVMARGATAAEKIVGVLHDVIEDGGGWAAHGDLMALLGGPGSPLVAALDALAHRKGIVDGRAWKEPYAPYIRRVAKNPLALRVKLHDLADNTLPWRARTLPAKAKRRLGRRYPAAIRYLTARLTEAS